MTAQLISSAEAGHPGILFLDVTTPIEQAEAFRAAIDALSASSPRG